MRSFSEIQFGRKCAGKKVGLGAVAAAFDLPERALWDCMAIGVLAVGFWIRLNCVFNGCCVGRESRGRFSVRLHDIYGVTKRRVPVQFLEMMW